MSADTGRPSLNSIKPDQKDALQNETAQKYHPKYFTDELFDISSVNRDDSFQSLGIITFNHVFTPNECSYLRQLTENDKNLSFWNKLGRENENARLFRDADTIEVVHPELAEMIWSRVRHLVNLQPIIIEENDVDHPLYERELPGKWCPVGMNQNFLFAVYPQGGHFAPHTDGRETHHFNRRSFYTALLYLNDIPGHLGGGTRFYHNDVLAHLQPSSTGQWTCPLESLSSYILTEIFSTSGTLLIFDQRLVHEGVPCSPAPHPCYKKYIIRSDIMYERDPPVVFSEYDTEAYKLFKEAEGLAELGKVDESIVKFKKACKLSPLLAAMMGH